MSPKAVRLVVFDALPPVLACAFRVERRRSVGHGMDQAALRSAVVHSDLRIATLPNNDYLRANVHQVITGDVTNLHAHGELTEIAAYINAGAPIRVYTPRREHLHGFRPKTFSH